MTPILLNAARAFAMTAFADGKLNPVEAHRFASVAAREPLLNTHGHAEIADAWAQANREVHAAQSFGAALLSIRSEIASSEEKELLLRVAQAAVVADGKLELQENMAITSLAEALGLDSNKY